MACRFNVPPSTTPGGLSGSPLPLPLHIYTRGLTNGNQKGRTQAHKNSGLSLFSLFSRLCFSLYYFLFSISYLFSHSIIIVFTNKGWLCWLKVLVALLVQMEERTDVFPLIYCQSIYIGRRTCD